MLNIVNYCRLELYSTWQPIDTHTAHTHPTISTPCNASHSVPPQAKPHNHATHSPHILSATRKEASLTEATPTTTNPHATATPVPPSHTACHCHPSSRTRPPSPHRHPSQYSHPTTYPAKWIQTAATNKPVVTHTLPLVPPHPHGRTSKIWCPV